jgi:hypothetical protein
VGSLQWGVAGGDFVANASASAWVNSSTVTAVFEGPGMVRTAQWPQAR